MKDNICVNCGSEIKMMCRKDWSRFCCELCEKGLKFNASEEDRTATTARIGDTLRLTSSDSGKDVIDRYNAVVLPITSEQHRKYVLDQVRQRIDDTPDSSYKPDSKTSQTSKGPTDTYQETNAVR